MSELAATVADVEIVIAATLSLLFAAVYTRSDWTSTRPGRSVMYLILALSSVLTLGAVTSVFGLAFPGRQQVRAVLFAGLIFTLLGLLRALRQQQRRTR